MAEETGLILEIGRWVLERACRDARVGRCPATDVPLSLSVNLSTRQMHDATLARHHTEVLDDNEFAASRLTLEITESALIDDAVVAPNGSTSSSGSACAWRWTTSGPGTRR